jgi:HAD superfamily hydrolase (TIGR01509 family)
LSKDPVVLSALLFDLDGTLADTNPLHYQAWEEILTSDCGIVLTPSLYDAQISGRTNAEITADLLPDWPIAAGIELADRKEARFRELAHTSLRPLPGLERLLQWLRDRHLPSVIVTNAPRANAVFMLQVLQLESTFQAVILAEEVAAGKPDPAPYQAGLERLGVEAMAAIALEDSPTGVRSAIGAGIATLGLTTTHPAVELLDGGAKLTIANFEDPKLWDYLNFRTSHP